MVGKIREEEWDFLFDDTNKDFDDDVFQALALNGGDLFRNQFAIIQLHVVLAQFASISEVSQSVDGLIESTCQFTFFIAELDRIANMAVAVIFAADWLNHIPSDGGISIITMFIRSSEGATSITVPNIWVSEFHLFFLCWVHSLGYNDVTKQRTQ